MSDKGYRPEMLSPTNIIAIYTFMAVLSKMKQQLGLEARLEYEQAYLHLLEQHNPEMKNAVKRAVEFINVRNIYLEIFKENEN